MVSVILSGVNFILICILLVRIVNTQKLKRKSIEDVRAMVTELSTQVPKIKVKYFTPELDELRYIEGQKSNWIDLRSAMDMKLKAGEFKLIPLGVAMELPEGYEAHITPRGSTFKTWGVIQTNSVGVVDHIYKGDNDQWFMPVYATRDTEIKFNERICQFRIMPIMGEVKFNKVTKLGSNDRGGHGSTGRI